MATSTVRFYGFKGNPFRRLHGAETVHTIKVTHDDNPDNWDRDRKVIDAIVKRLAGRSATVPASFNSDRRAKAMARAIARTSGYVMVPLDPYGEVNFQIVALTTN